MGEMYRKPLRVYLLLGACSVWGLVSYLGLSTSLFPIANQTTVSVSISYSSYSSKQFFESVGRDLEAQLQKVKVNGTAVVLLEADYRDRKATYIMKYGWGADPDEAIRLVESQTRSFVSRFEQGIRDSVSVDSWNENQGFFALSFYSPLRSLDEVYQILDPIFRPVSSMVEDAENVILYNPSGKELTVLINPQKMAQYELTPKDIELAIQDAVFSLSGGSISIGQKGYQIRLPKRADSVGALSQIRVSPMGKKVVLLKDVANLKVDVSESSSQRFKTSGVESLIFFASPKSGGNVKRMSDEILSAVEAKKSQWPSDIQFKVLVNPSEFIAESIEGVLKEVGLAAFLAVLVLFVFIGSFRNVVTAAIEIPLSLLLAFILMKLTGMNLNLISLGGLALSAGMNVDASVVVLENIFRHFEGKNKNLTFEEKYKILVAAVDEVKMPILASTFASLVVFIPLIFTNGLANSLLGDLAKAVIFSHGLSALVALVLVPTIRLHLMKNGDLAHVRSPFEGALSALGRIYENSLSKFLRSWKSQFVVFFAVFLSFPILFYFVVPNLKKEIIGVPETDWLILNLTAPLADTPKKVQADLDQLEQDLFQRFPDQISYTFTQTSSSGGMVMLRLKKKAALKSFQKILEDVYKNTPEKSYLVMPWNPSELRIPNPPDFKLEISEGDPKRRVEVVDDLVAILSDPGVFDNVNTGSSGARSKGISVVPYANLSGYADLLSRADLSHYLRVATDGLYVESIFQDNYSLPIYLRMPEFVSSNLENLSSLPLAYNGRLIPLGALANFSLEEKEPAIFRENQRQVTVIEAKMNDGNKALASERVLAAREAIQNYLKKIGSKKGLSNPVVEEVAAGTELNTALSQLAWAIGISVLLIFLVMVLQLGDVVHSLLVLVAIPLGFIGVIVSLAVFGSTLSLNSGLGTILLNGIAVANSIILVDFIRRQFESGLSPLVATVSASSARFRPILMTSLTTVLGMLPIALGFGAGGQTLQPLGIAVSGGLWVSSLLTLYLVPCLQYHYLSFKKQKGEI